MPVPQPNNPDLEEQLRRIRRAPVQQQDINEIDIDEQLRRLRREVELIEQANLRVPPVNRHIVGAQERAFDGSGYRPVRISMRNTRTAEAAYSQAALGCIRLSTRYFGILSTQQRQEAYDLLAAAYAHLRRIINDPQEADTDEYEEDHPPRNQNGLQAHSPNRG